MRFRELLFWVIFAALVVMAGYEGDKLGIECVDHFTGAADPCIQIGS